MKDSGSSLANSGERKNKLPYDNYGSFFGPSQPVIAQRVIEESKSLLENQHLAERVSKSKHGNNKVHASAPVGSRPRVNDDPPKVTNVIKTQTKVQMLKNTRDYSFLLSDDAEPPAPTKDPPPRNVTVSRPGVLLLRFFGDVKEGRSDQVPLKSKLLSSNNAKNVFNVCEESRNMPTSKKMESKVGPHKLASGNKPMSSMDRKQHGSNNGSGPGRPQALKGIPSKVSLTYAERKIISSGAKNSIPIMHKPLVSKSQPSIPKQTLDRRRELQESSKGKFLSRQQVSSESQRRRMRKNFARLKKKRGENGLRKEAKKRKLSR